jgi:hypothetical protein
VCYKKYSDFDGRVDWRTKGVDIAAYLRKKKFFPQELRYSVVFHIKDRDKFMKGLGSQIIDYMKGDSSEEIGAVVDMVGFTDLTKYQRYSDFICSAVDTGGQGENLPDFEAWVQAGEPSGYDRYEDYDYDLDQ